MHISQNVKLFLQDVVELNTVVLLGEKNTLMWKGQEVSCGLILEDVIANRQEKLNDDERKLCILKPSLDVLYVASVTRCFSTGSLLQVSTVNFTREN